MRIASLLPLLCLIGCVSVASLHGAVKTNMEANTAIAVALDDMDAECQSLARDAVGLAACRIPRDKVRAALRAQVDAFASWAK